MNKKSNYVELFPSSAQGPKMGLSSSVALSVVLLSLLNAVTL